MTKYFILIFSVFFLTACQNMNTEEHSVVLKRRVKVDAAVQYQNIDGFGVNINPAQWHDGNLKQLIDTLVDDLGATLFRFDCVGFADWLDPSQRTKSGKYSDDYLKTVYTSKMFTDAWATFRYLNSKGIVPFFNVSGKIPAALADSEHPRFLKDFDGYAEMIVTMLHWAHEEEKLGFNLLDPYNETDLGYRDWMPAEGPGLYTKDLVPLTKLIAEKLDAFGLSEIKLMVMSDSDPTVKRISGFLQDSTLQDKITHYGFHIYGGYHDIPKKLVDTIDNSVYQGSRKWMTEYGDLDLSGLVEHGVYWRSTKMLMNFMNSGFNGGIIWDAYDNYHKHDEAWSNFGLIETDTINWTYSPKPRYFAAKQVYRFVRPDFKRIDFQVIPENNEFDVYKDLKNPFRYIDLMSFASQDKKDFTIVGMSEIEGDVALNFDLQNFSNLLLSKKIFVYRTSKTKNCEMTEETMIINGNLQIVFGEKEIVTITTVDR